VLQSITTLISSEGINIENFVSRSRGEYAYAILDLSEKLSAGLIEKIRKTENVIRVRVL